MIIWDHEYDWLRACPEDAYEVRLPGFVVRHSVTLEYMNLEQDRWVRSIDEATLFVSAGDARAAVVRLYGKHDPTWEEIIKI